MCQVSDAMPAGFRREYSDAAAPLSVHAPCVRRGLAEMLPEHAVEMRQVVEAGRKGDGADRALRRPRMAEWRM